MLPELLAFLECSKVSIDTEYRWSNLKKAFELTEVGLASDTDTVVKLKADAGDKLDGSKVDTDSLRSQDWWLCRGYGGAQPEGVGG